MHSTSLIGQALGGATGTKASKASDTSQDTSKAITAKSSKERPFADYVEGDSAKADAASAPAQEKLASKAAKQGDADSDVDTRAPETPAFKTSASKENLIAGQHQAEPEGEQTSQTMDPEIAEAEIAGADGFAADPRSRQSQTSSKLGIELQAEAAQAGEKTSAQAKSADGDAAIAEEGRTQVGKFQSPDVKADASVGEGQAQPGGATGKETLAGQAPERIGAGDKKVAQAEASVDRKADMPTAPLAGQSRPDVVTERSGAVATARSGPEAAARSGPEEPARSGAETTVRSQQEAARAAVPLSEAQVKAQAASNSGQINSGQIKSGQGPTTADAAVITEAETTRAGGEKASEARAVAAPSAAASATQAASQSVFQMQVQNAEVGDARKSRYRVRAGDSQPLAEAKNAKPAPAATNAGAPTVNSAIAIAQPVQSVTAKFSQNPSLVADSVAGQANLTSDLPGLPQLLTEAVFQPGATHRVETPRLIATQLAEAFAAKGERNMDVSLNPEELGRVKMRVSTNETGIVMTIQTERPETGDLMRRHINELAEEFRRMGFQDISFEFSSGDSSGGQAEQGLGGEGGGRLGGTAEMAVTDPAADTEKQNLQLGSSGVDMRV